MATKAEKTEVRGPLEIEQSPNVTLLRHYKPSNVDEEALRKEGAKLGTQLRAKADDLEGTMLARVVNLATDYVEFCKRNTNDVSKITSASVRGWLRVTLMYGTPNKDNTNTVVAKDEQSSVIDNAITTATKAAFLFHAGFNGCDIRHFIGHKVVPQGTKNSQPRFAMPYNKWLPEFKQPGKAAPVENRDDSYKPLPKWAIDAQYELYMSDGKKELDPATGKVKRGTGKGDESKSEAGTGGKDYAAVAAIVESAAENQEVSIASIRAAVAVVDALITKPGKFKDVLKNEDVQTILANLNMHLTTWAEQDADKTEEKKPAKTERKTA